MSKEMKRILQLFSIRKEERNAAIVALMTLVALNALTIARYSDKFMQIAEQYHKFFVTTFKVSGFDPITYTVLSNWGTYYNVYRHPLLAFFMYIPNQINQGLMMVTGQNWTQFITAFMLIFAGFYSFIFLYRIMRDVVGISRCDANILCAFFFAFSYIILSMMVPDHFILSMMMLLLTLYICGMKMKGKRLINTWQTVVLFVITAGISLNNGLKTYLAALFTNGKQFFRPRYFFLAVLLPPMFMWIFARTEYHHYVWPKEMARKEKKAKIAQQKRDSIYKAFMDTTSLTDSTKIKEGVRKIIRQRAHAKYVSDHKMPVNMHMGKPMANGEFSRWTDISTPRGETFVENLFGESIQLHKEHLLEDILRDFKPIIVHYKSAVPYVIEAVILLLFALGIWCGRKSRFLWTAISFFLLDMALHLGLGFGINEVYIMTAHWAYVVPIAIAYVVKVAKRRTLLRVALIALAVYLWAYNLSLIVPYMLA